MKFVAFDGNSLLNRAFYGVKGLSNAEGFPTNAIFGFFNILNKILNDLCPDYVMVAFDVKGKTFRHEKFDKYKSGRKPMPNDLFLQLVEVKKMLSFLGIYCCEFAGFEADDLLGTIARICTEQNVQCFIASGDRDILQLVDSNVKVRLSTNKKEIWFDESKVLDQFGVKPKQLIEVKALMGDASDNIIGVRGIGEKTAFSLIKNFGTVDFIFKNLENLQISARVKNLLTAPGAKELCFLSRELGKIVLTVDLNDDLSVYKPNKVDWFNLKSFLKKFELKKILNSFNKSGFFGCFELPDLEMVSEKIKTLPVLVDEDLNLVKNKLCLEPVLHFLFHNDFLYIITSNEIFKFVNLKLRAFHVLVSDNEKPKKTTNIKDIYKFCLKNAFKLTNVVFSCDLAGYLIDVLDKNNDVVSLTEKFFNCGDFLGCFCKLCSKLEEELSNKNLNSLFFDVEMPLALVLAEMEVCGFRIDESKLKFFGNKLESRVEILKKEIWQFCGEQFNLNSTKELANILFNKLKLPKTRKTKTGYSTDAEALQKLVKHSSVIEKILNYRTLTKLISTYVHGLQKVIKNDGRIHSVFKQTHTRTGRISSTEPNIQNIPIKTEIGSEMRKFFVAGSGNVLVDCDYSQIELRILAEISNDKNMINAFKKGEDIHNLTASKLFGCDVVNVPVEFRRRAKVVNFSVVYGISPFSLAQDLGVMLTDARNYIKSFFEVYSGVRDYFDEVVDLAKKTGEVKTLFGRVRKIPELKSKFKKTIALGERIAKNTPIQGSCADLIKVAMIKIRDRLKKEQLQANLILQIHDELLVEVKEENSKQVALIVKEEMESVLKIRVPLVANVSIGKTWFDCKNA